jgi:hypothetical protein
MIQGRCEGGQGKSDFYVITGAIPQAKTDVTLGVGNSIPVFVGIASVGVPIVLLGSKKCLRPVGVPV